MDYMVNCEMITLNAFRDGFGHLTIVNDTFIKDVILMNSVMYLEYLIYIKNTLLFHIAKYTIHSVIQGGSKRAK